MARCARCHEPDGNSATASEQAGRPVDLRADEFQNEFTDLRIRYIMINGEGKMQGIGGIRDAEADSILRSPQGRQIAEMMHYTAVGDAETVAAYLADFVDRVGADELMTVHPSPTLSDRLASIEILADTLGG